LLPLVEAIPAVRGKRGRPRKRPRRVQGDRAYDSEPHRQVLRKQGIEPVLAKRNTEHGSGLGVIDGLLSGPSVGSIKCAAYAPVTNDATISTKPSSHSAASSFAATSSKSHFVRRSK
jgi:hypothetical protein